MSKNKLWKILCAILSCFFVGEIFELFGLTYYLLFTSPFQKVNMQKSFTYTIIFKPVIICMILFVVMAMFCKIYSKFKDSWIKLSNWKKNKSEEKVIILFTIILLIISLIIGFILSYINYFKSGLKAFIFYAISYSFFSYIGIPLCFGIVMMIIYFIMIIPIIVIKRYFYILEELIYSPKSILLHIIGTIILIILNLSILYLFII